MYVQPLLLTALTAHSVGDSHLPPMGRPGIGPGFEVRRLRKGAADRASDDRNNGAESASRDLPRIDLRDTVEISQEAEAKLVGQLAQQSQREVLKLQATDRKVRAHEQAHLAAAGPYARGGASFEYTTGPDGRRYAVGGEVSIDASPVPDDPKATIQKAQVIRAAAMAPAEPSAQDRRMAAAATKMEAEARKKLREQQQAEQEEASAGGDRPTGTLFAAAAASQNGGFEEFIGTHFNAVA